MSKNLKRLSLMFTILFGLFLANTAAASGTGSGPIQKNTSSSNPRGQAQLAKKTVTVDGELIVVIEDDFAHKKARLRYLVRKPNQKTVQIKINGKTRHLKTGMRVSVTGEPIAQTDPKSSGDTETIEQSQVTVLSAVAAPVSALAAAQIRKVVVILVDITDGTGLKHAVNSSCDGSKALASDRMFGTSGGRNVDGCYADASFNSLGFGGASYPGRTSDVVRVSITDATTSWATTCNFGTWEEKADIAAGSKINLANYQHRLYVLPKSPGCQFIGSAWLGCPGSFCRAAVIETGTMLCGYRDAYTHELGHNLGMTHSATDPENDGTAECQYCDTSDFMGFSIDSHRGMNAPHKDQMGWLGGSRQVDASLGGTFTISAVELMSPPFPQALKIIPRTKSSWGSPYYVSFRAPFGYDDALTTLTPTLMNTARIHRFDGSGLTVKVARLADGEQFVDASNDLTITTLSHTVDSITVRVDLTPPKLTIDKAYLAEGDSGSSLMNFTARLSAPNRTDVSFDIETAPGTAMPGVDFLDTSLVNRVIPAGQLTTSFSIPVLGDTNVEMDETFAVEFRNVTGVPAPQQRGLGVIVNDDMPTISISDATVVEANSGEFSTLAFAITLSAPISTTVTYSASTGAGAAVAGGDYAGFSHSGLVIDPGRTRTVYYVKVFGDDIGEATETMTVTLGQLDNAVMGRSIGTGTIEDNDFYSALPAQPSVWGVAQTTSQTATSQTAWAVPASAARKSKRNKPNKDASSKN